MAYFTRLMSMILDFLKTPFTLWGYDFSFWGVFMTIAVLSLAFMFIRGVFSD